MIKQVKNSYCHYWVWVIAQHPIAHICQSLEEQTVLAGFGTDIVRFTTWPPKHNCKNLLISVW